MKWSVSSVLKRYGQQYLDRFGKTMTAQQKKVLRAVMACREEALGTVRYQCLSCGDQHTIPRSCCNRHCSACQHQRTQDWLTTQSKRLLPCDYFLITFTVPEEVRAAMLAHPKETYAALLGAAAESLKVAATNARHVGAVETGFVGVLHTWGRDLAYHPHAHFVVPSGGLNEAGEWKSSRASLFVPEQILAILFRNKLRDRLKGTASFKAIPASAWTRRWTVDSKAVGNGGAVLKYLAPYVIRGAVSDWRASWCDGAESLDDAMMKLQVKPSGKRRYKEIDLSVRDFIRRWLHHVLPTGFHRVRHYGFLNPSSKRSLEDLRILIAVALEKLYYLFQEQQIVSNQVNQLRCPTCGGAMVSLGYFPPSDKLNSDYGRNLALVAEREEASPARAPPLLSSVS